MYAGMRCEVIKQVYLEAMSGVDIALVGPRGKATARPIYQLLGGEFRNPVRVYASGLPALTLTRVRKRSQHLTRSPWNS